MGKLTIGRERAVAACLTTTKVYITSNAVCDEGKEVMIGRENAGSWKSRFCRRIIDVY